MHKFTQPTFTSSLRTQPKRHQQREEEEGERSQTSSRGRGRRSTSTPTNKNSKKRWQSPQSGRYSKEKKRSYTPPAHVANSGSDNNNDYRYGRYDSNLGGISYSATSTPLNKIMSDSNETEQFWKTMLMPLRSPPQQQQQQEGKGGDGDNRKRMTTTPTRRKVVSASVVQEESHNRNHHHHHHQRPCCTPERERNFLAAPVSTLRLEEADIIRLDEMLITGLYRPSGRIEKLETMLSREMALWEHVVSSNSNSNSYSLLQQAEQEEAKNHHHHPLSDIHRDIISESPVVGTYSHSLAVKKQSEHDEIVARSNNSTRASSAALTALMQIHSENGATATESGSEIEKERAQQKEKHGREYQERTKTVFSSPIANVSDPASVTHPVSYTFAANSSFSSSHFTPSTAATMITRDHRSISPTRSSSRTASASSVTNDQLRQEVQDRIRTLDVEVEAVDVECRSLISQLMNLQEKQQKDEGQSLNEMFLDLQRSLARTQERRERLVAMRAKLIDSAAKL